MARPVPNRSQAAAVRNQKRLRIGGMYRVSAQPSGENSVSRISRESCERL